MGKDTVGLTRCQLAFFWIEWGKTYEFHKQSMIRRLHKMDVCVCMPGRVGQGEERCAALGK